MCKKFQVLIVGGGNAGISTAAQLLKKEKTLNIGIIEPSKKHYYQPAWTLVGAGELTQESTVKPQKDVMPKGVFWIENKVLTFQPEQNQLTCEDGSVYEYDYLIVAPGIKINWDGIEGLSETLGKNNVCSNYDFELAPKTWEFIKNFKGGIAVFTNPSTPIKCGGAPHKIMYLACDYWTKKGIMDKTQVHYVSGSASIFGVKEYAATLEKILKKHNIQTHFNSKILSVNGEASEIIFETTDTPSNVIKKFSPQEGTHGCYSISAKSGDEAVSHITLNHDFLHVVPPMEAPDFIKASVLADQKSPYGYVEIDQYTMQHKRFANVFSLGDCTNAPTSKTGAAIRKQAPVVVENLLSLMRGKELKAKYQGYTACPIPTQYGKLMMAEFDYSNTPKMTFPFDQTQPRWSMWMFKKYLLPWLYWKKILKGEA